MFLGTKVEEQELEEVKELLKSDLKFISVSQIYVIVIVCLKI